jgi:hypothetical protein
MSAEPTIVIRLDGETLSYRPGEKFSGHYRIKSLEELSVKAIEASVLWYTEGKGDEDMAIHEFWRRDADDVYPIDPARPERFSTTLPNSPLSYEGRILKLRWCIRVRAFPSRGKEIVSDKIFQLGDVPPIRPASS